MRKIQFLVFLAFFLISFSNVKAQLRTELLDQIKPLSWNRSMLAERHIKINCSEDFWKYLVNPDNSPQGATAFSNISLGIVNFSKVMGWADLTPLDGYDYGDKAIQDQTAKLADGFKDKISLTIDASSLPNKKEYYSLILRYAATIGEFWESSSYQSGIEGWKAKGDAMHVKLIINNSVKDISYVIKGDTITITAPYEKEPETWDSKIKQALTKMGK